MNSLKESLMKINISKLKLSDKELDEYCTIHEVRFHETLMKLPNKDKNDILMGFFTQQVDKSYKTIVKHQASISKVNHIFKDINIRLQDLDTFILELKIWFFILRYQKIIFGLAFENATKYSKAINQTDKQLNINHDLFLEAYYNGKNK